MESQIKKILKQLDLGKVALLSDSSDLKISEEILILLQNRNIDVNLILVPNKAKELIDHSIWQNFSRVFIALNQAHYLSSGHIQSLLDLLCIDYTGSGALASALANDMIKSKKLWQSMGIATVPFVKILSNANNIDWQEIIGLLGFPVAVRSAYACDGRIFKATNIEQIMDACRNFEVARDIIIEPFVTGYEYLVYILDNQALMPLYVDNLFNSFSRKESHKRLKIEAMQKLAMDAFMSIGGQGLAVVNIIKDLNDDCWVSSINTSPVIVRNGYFSEAASHSGIEFELLVEKVLITSFIKKTNYQHKKLSKLK